MNYLNGAGHGCFADGMAVDFSLVLPTPYQSLAMPCNSTMFGWIQHRQNLHFPEDALESLLKRLSVVSPTIVTFLSVVSPVQDISDI
jgi:hypothetical protein